jgi:hypothetical protein
MDDRAKDQTGDARRPNPRVIHISFADQKFTQSLALLRRSALKHGIDEFRGYTPEHPAVRQAADENPEIFSLKRGAGYWIWKPYILLDTLNSVPEGTLVIYTDAGIRYITSAASLFAQANDADILLFHNPGGGPQSTWTKRDCFVLMQADTPEFWHLPQLDAAIQIYRVGTQARRFVGELKQAMRDPRILTDQPNECGLPNFDDFRDHRHDQSVLTVLAHRYGIEPQTSPKSVTSPEKPLPRPGAIFEHHRTRDVPPLLHRWWTILEAIGIRGISDRKRYKRRRRKR